jgi:hypothetical protein
VLAFEGGEGDAEGFAVLVGAGGVDGGLRLDDEIGVRLGNVEVVDVVEPVVAEVLEARGGA